MIESAVPLEVLGIAGSLRQGSHNRALLRAAARVAPPSVRIRVYEGLEGIPVFSEDLESVEALPPAVCELRDAVASTDGLLLATPEYNQSVPGVMKNLVDWLSREDGLAGRPMAVIGASTGPWGTRIAQTLLRQMLLSVEGRVMPAPMLFVPRVETLADADGEIVDPETLERLAQVVTSFGRWIQVVKDLDALSLT